MRLSPCIMRFVISALALTAGSLQAETLLHAEPSGAWIQMHGAVSVAGVSPVPIDELPPGTYHFSASGPGLPAVRGRLNVSERSMRQRSWAGPATLLLPPGLSHLQNGEQRGWMFLGSGTLGAGMFLRALGEVSEADDDLDRARAVYSSAVSVDGIREARDELDVATMRRDDEEELARLWIGFTAVTWASAAVESWFLTPQPHLRPNDGGGYRVTLPKAAPWKSAIRSMLVPGSGQRYMGHGERATLLSAGVAIAGAGALFAHESFLDARREQAREQARYDRANTQTELADARTRLADAASRTDDRSTLRWVLAGGAAGVYLWNVIDAWRVGENGPTVSAQATAPTNDFSIGLVPSHHGVFAAATWSLR